MSESKDSNQPLRANRSRIGWAAKGVLLALASAAILTGCDASDSGDSSNKINGSVHVAAGKAPEPVSTVNGSIHVEDNATITSANTVNGSVHLGDQATAASLKTVNGSITLGKGAHLSGAATSVNGELTLNEGADVTGALVNVNGKITVTGAHIGGGIKTVNGSMTITGASHIEGGVLVKKSSNELLHFGNDVPRIVIGPGATVQGELRFERKVELYVSDKATVGTVTGATAVPFSGDSPPN